MTLYATDGSVTFNGAVWGLSPSLNSGNSSIDNGSTLFPDFYDGFYGTTLDTTKWTVSSGSVTVNNSLTITNPTVSDTTNQISSNNGFSYPTIFETYAQFIPETGTGSGNVLAGLTASNSYFAGWQNYNSAYVGGDWDNGSWVNIASQPSNSTYYVWSILINSSYDGTIQYNYSNDTTPSAYTSISSAVIILLSQDGSNREIQANWVRVRSYVAQQPTVTFTGGYQVRLKTEIAEIGVT